MISRMHFTLALLALFLCLASTCQADKDKYCNDDSPSDSLWSRLFHREVIVPWPANAQTKRADGWWKQDGRFPNSSLAIRNDGRGLVNDTTGEAADLAARWEFTCKTPHVVCGNLFNGIRRYGGATPFRVDWNAEKKFTTLLYWYFQPTVGLVGDGGSGTWYPAHGCQKVCVKGRMQAHFTTTDVWVKGIPGSNKSFCVFPFNIEEEVDFTLQRVHQ